MVYLLALDVVELLVPILILLLKLFLNKKIRKKKLTGIGLLRIGTCKHEASKPQAPNPYKFEYIFFR
jgi:hypothetical protein